MKAYYKRNKEDIKRSSYEKGRKDGVDGFAIMLCSVLADKWGFGKIRMQRMINQVQYVADSINKGYITTDDLIEELYEKHNIQIDFKRVGKNERA
jgi:hypothetical protein